MIILDTDVIVETQKPNPDPLVMSFLDQLDPTTTYITSLTVAELLYSVDRMPSGSSKRALEDAIFKISQDDFKDRVLACDLSAASHYAIRAADAKGRNGVTVGFADGLIGGIARSNCAKVATRNVRTFEAMGIDTINPWEPPKSRTWTIEE